MHSTHLRALGRLRRLAWLSSAGASRGELPERPVFSVEPEACSQGRCSESCPAALPEWFSTNWNVSGTWAPCILSPQM